MKNSTTKTPKAVLQAHTAFLKAEANMRQFISDNDEIVELLADYVEKRNIERKNLEQACRSHGVGVEGITVSSSTTPVYDVNRLDDILRRKAPELRKTVIIRSLSIDTGALQRALADGSITTNEIQDAVVGSKPSIRVTGIPPEFLMP